MNGTVTPRAVGTPLRRLDGRAKVTGTAPYAYEHPLPGPVHVHPLQATVARGRVRTVDTAAAAALDGVIAVLTHDDAPRLQDTGDAELAVLQSAEVAFRGQFIGAVVAESPETAREAAGLVSVAYDAEPHDTELRADRTDLYTPRKVNAGFAADTEDGDVLGAFTEAPVVIDETYRTPMEHNNPMEPHTCVALWEPGQGGPRLTLYDSTQGAHGVREAVAAVFGLDAERVRVIAPHVGGGFGSKGMPHAHNVLAVMAAQRAGGRPAKLALTRQQMFSLTGYRTPTIQRLRLAADNGGRLLALSHEAVVQTSRVKEYAEQAAVVTRMMYAAPHRRTRHRVAALDVPVPSWMRAPGEAPGMYALESAMDELACALDLDPVELRVRNEPETDPESGRPWSGRKLIECLHTGARRFDWHRRGPAGTRRVGDWQVGLGVAAATYPFFGGPGTSAEIEYLADGGYAVRTGAADIGTGTWTALTQIAADALDVPVAAVRVEIGDTALPYATVAGGSSGMTSWGSAVVAAARAFRAEHGERPRPGARVRADAPPNPDRERFALYSFGAHFAEARVHRRTGEVRVSRMLGVFSAGRIINPVTARSQFLGGMVMGLSMALHEESRLDPATGHVVNHDLAEYHVPVCADVGGMEAVWLEESDPHANAVGSRGIGEIGIVGSPAAVVNAVHNATGVRVRDLPVTPDKLLR
ncbi:xanthine dehydrogenase family protein molybdopterin-binding subunit [Streptomyces sp. TRM 70351]|uniref:xanthine dehydrogenase family protein molybdopterin-binding subunit n=1 Tax=Streptomyces sp. TRM 70351 TaxID=3116552 RepID=UPI002E7B163E|nr:xanthine dehydrogenase family protein molybdopterin-binding subunit [Streptomyces sp. TRM 70351]MEE1927096.1 xanthine dehydrogenase family protein molybdopterin-binding subunit [Streptomyces sp. TRM 70351]